MTDDFMLPDIPQPKQDAKVEDDFKDPVAFKVAVIGLGQGGGRIAEAFYNVGYRRVCALNTAQEDLADLNDAIPKLDLGGGGAGNDIDQGAAAVEHNAESIREHIKDSIGDDVDYVLVCASLGGGTGSGGVTPLIEQCRRFLADEEIDAKVGAIISLPTEQEGAQVAHNSVQAFSRLGKLRPLPSPLLIIDNKKMQEIYAGQVGAGQLYRTANAQIVNLFHLFNRLAKRRSSLITFDASDLARLLDGGIVCFGANQLTDYKKVTEITAGIRAHLDDNMWADVDYSQGRAAGCLFCASQDVVDVVPMEHFNEGYELLQRQLAEGAHIYRGIYVMPLPEKQLRCYTMYSALPVPRARLTKLWEAASKMPEAKKKEPKIGDYYEV